VQEPSFEIPGGKFRQVLSGELLTVTSLSIASVALEVAAINLRVDRDLLIRASTRVLGIPWCNGDIET